MSYVEAPRGYMVRQAPCECVNAASRLFERFHRFSPEEVKHVRCLRVIPHVLMRVGELRGLIYKSDRGRCGSPRTFIHFMRTPATLACDPNGKQLYVVGGCYRVTRKGIEG